MKKELVRTCFPTEPGYTKAGTVARMENRERALTNEKALRKKVMHDARRHVDQMTLAIMFDVDGCLISRGGADMISWRSAFERLHGIPADIEQFSQPGIPLPGVVLDGGNSGPAR